MVGQSEYIRNPNGDTTVAMIERGTQGDQTFPTVRKA